MEQVMPDWLMLIKHWTDRNGTGYTLPFLLGARYLKEGNSSPSLDDARDLLQEIFIHPFERYTIQAIFCNDLQTLVFGMYRSSPFFRHDHPTTNGIFFNNPETQRPSIFIRQDMVDKYGSTLEQLTTNIVDDFAHHIINCEFSRSRNKIWSPLTSDETTRIKNILGIT
jgi:hypothetical protein